MVHYIIIIIIIGWCFTPLLTVFQSYHGDSSHYSCHSWVLPVLGWGSEVSCPKTLPRKTERIQCGSNPGPLIYESNTLPLSHAGPVEWFSYVINVQYICCKEINSKDMTSLKSGNEDSNRFVRLQNMHFRLHQNTWNLAAVRKILERLLFLKIRMKWVLKNDWKRIYMYFSVQRLVSENVSLCLEVKFCWLRSAFKLNFKCTSTRVLFQCTQAVFLMKFILLSVKP